MKFHGFVCRCIPRDLLHVVLVHLDKYVRLREGDTRQSPLSQDCPTKHTIMA